MASMRSKSQKCIAYMSLIYRESKIREFPLRQPMAVGGIPRRRKNPTPVTENS